MTKSRKTSQEEQKKIAKECLENEKNYEETAQNTISATSRSIHR